MPNVTRRQSHYVPYQISDCRHENHEKYSQIVDKVVSSHIDDATLLKIKQNTILSLYDLLTPIENHRTLKIPRPQNSFVIYRRNLQAKMALSNTPNSSLERLDKISKIAGDKWKNESKEIKEIFTFIADCAKKVHDHIFPGYVFNPRKYASTKVPMDSPLRNDIQLSPSFQITSSQFGIFNISNNNNHNNKTQYQYQYPNSIIDLPSTLEITPNFMNSYDDKICKILDKNTQNFF